MLHLLALALQLNPGDLVSLPFARGEQIFTSRATRGGVDFCVQDGLSGKPRVIVTAKEAPLDAKYPLSDFAVSDNGRICAYLIAQPDSRFQEIRFIDIQTGKRLADTLQWTYYGDMAWEKNGVFYGAFSKPAGNANPHQNEKIYFHRLGTPQSQDRVAFQDPGHPNRRYQFLTSFDHRYFLLHKLERVNGKQTASEWFRPDDSIDGPFTAIEPDQAEGRFYLADNDRDKLVLHTQYKAPAGKVIQVDTHHPDEAHWKTLLPEPVDDCEPILGKLLVLKNGKALLYSMQGALLGKVQTDEGWSPDVQSARKNEKYVFFSLAKGPFKHYYWLNQNSLTLIPFK
jgi:prolyl oligopeptidase